MDADEKNKIKNEYRMFGPSCQIDGGAVEGGREDWRKNRFWGTGSSVLDKLGLRGLFNVEVEMLGRQREVRVWGCQSVTHWHEAGV